MLATFASLIISVVGLVLGSVLGWWVFKLADFSAELRPVLRSVIFQGVLALLALYATSSGQSILASAFLLSALAKSFYLQYHDHRNGRLENWFGVLKEPLTAVRLVGYFVVVGVIFVYSLVNFVM